MDNKKILELIQEVDHEFLPALSDKNFDRLGHEGSLEEYINILTKKGKMLCEEENGKIIGALGYFPEFEKYDSGFIEFVGVKKNKRRHGIATQLMEKCFTNMKKERVKKITIRTWSTNKPGIELYKKIGFKEKEIQKDNRKKGIDSIIFEKEL